MLILVKISNYAHRTVLTLSLPNATVVEFTVHCQTRLQSKFKGTADTCLFLIVIRDSDLCLFISKCSGYIILSYIDVFAIFRTRMVFAKNICNVIRFRGNQKYRKHVHGDDIQDALSPSTAIFWFISDETIYQNISWRLILDVDGCFIYFCMY